MALPPGPAASSGGMGLAFPCAKGTAGGTRHGRMGHSRYWPSISHDWSLNTPRSHGCRLDWRVWLDGDELSRQERHLAAVAEKVRSRYRVFVNGVVPPLH